MHISSVRTDVTVILKYCIQLKMKEIKIGYKQQLLIVRCNLINKGMTQERKETKTEINEGKKENKMEDIFDTWKEETN